MKKIILAIAMLLTIGAQAQNKQYTYTVNGMAYDVCQVSDTQNLTLTELSYRIGGQKYLVYKDNKGIYCIILKDKEGQTYRYDLPEIEQKMYAYEDKHQNDWDIDNNKQ